MKEVLLCEYCNNQFARRRCGANRFCNKVCEKNKQYTDKVAMWLKGEELGWKGRTRQLKEFVRRYLRETRGTACEICGWDVKHPVDNKHLTEVDHIDGNAENCSPCNLRILCPNCHSMTPTFRRRNIFSTRER